jgi:hypothetical protein
MTLNFFVVFEGQEIDQRSQESGFYDRRLVERVYRHIPYTGSRGENQGKVSRLQEAEKR